MPYKSWSPFEKPEYMRHQIKLIEHNARFIVDVLGVGSLVLALIALVVMRPWQNRREVLWAWALPLVALMSSLYLPVFAGAPRYYLFCYPLLLGSALLLALVGKETLER